MRVSGRDPRCGSRGADDRRHRRLWFHAMALLRQSWRCRSSAAAYATLFETRSTAINLRWVDVVRAAVANLPESERAAAARSWRADEICDDAAERPPFDRRAWLGAVWQPMRVTLIVRSTPRIANAGWLAICRLRHRHCADLLRARCRHSVHVWWIGTRPQIQARCLRAAQPRSCTR